MSSSDTLARKDQAEAVDYVAGHLLTRAATLVRLLVKQVRNREVSRTEGEVLGILQSGPRRVTELAELEGLAQPTMTQLIRRLQERGWVTRGGLCDDARVVMVTITDAGRATVDAFRDQYITALRSDLEGLSEEQLAALVAAADTLGSFVEVLQRRVGT